MKSIPRTLTCAHCGQDYKASRVRQPHYCSSRCRTAAHRAANASTADHKLDWSGGWTCWKCEGTWQRYPRGGCPVPDPPAADRNGIRWFPSMSQALGKRVSEDGRLVDAGGILEPEQTAEMRTARRPTVGLFSQPDRNFHSRSGFARQTLAHRIPKAQVSAPRSTSPPLPALQRPLPICYNVSQ